MDEKSTAASGAERGIAPAAKPTAPSAAHKPTVRQPPAAANYRLLESACKSYMDAEGVEKVERAYRFAADYHRDQRRRSGEPYINHPVEVALILAKDLRMDEDTICAALLHDTVEDTSATLEQLKGLFGETVADLVDGVTKLTSVKVATMDEKQAWNLRKMFLAMSHDIRVVIIKLADRLHNMRTLAALPPDRRLFKARETMDVYAPLADRLGISSIKWELEDLAFFWLEPEEYQRVARMVQDSRAQREDDAEAAMKTLDDELKRVGLKDYQITGRPKHLWSIYLKMTRKGRDFSEIYDLIALRVITQTVGDCYSALGAVHTLWHPLPGRFNDYIATPKANLYQSLHNTVVGPDGRPIEIQIRAKVNGSVVPLTYKLNMGDRVEILTNKNAKPSHDWMSVVVTPSARAKIRKYFSTESKSDDAEQGRAELARELRRRGYGIGAKRTMKAIDRACEGLNAKDADDLFAAVHTGKVTANLAANRIEEILNEGSPEQLAATAKEAEAKAARAKAMAGNEPIMKSYAIAQADKGKKRRTNCGVVVKGDADLLVHLAHCCNPVAGDDIVGFITRGRGVSVHRATCPNVAGLMAHPERMIDVAWDTSGATEFRVEIVVEATDRMGLLKDVTIAIGDAGGNILSAATQTSSQGIARLRFLVSISDASLLDSLLATVSRVPSVYDARRLMPGEGAQQLSRRG